MPIDMEFRIDIEVIYIYGLTERFYRFRAFHFIILLHLAYTQQILMAEKVF
jgi:hypothetical protein